MIVIDASALLEALLRTLAPEAVERRFFDSRRTLKRRICLTSKSQKSFVGVRCPARSVQGVTARLSRLSQIFRCAATHAAFYCRARRNCETLWRPMMPFNTNRRWDRPAFSRAGVAEDGAAGGGGGGGRPSGGLIEIGAVPSPSRPFGSDPSLSHTRSARARKASRVLDARGARSCPFGGLPQALAMALCEGDACTGGDGSRREEEETVSSGDGISYSYRSARRDLADARWASRHRDRPSCAGRACVKGRRSGEFTPGRTSAMGRSDVMTPCGPAPRPPRADRAHGRGFARSARSRPARAAERGAGPW